MSSSSSSLSSRDILVTGGIGYIGSHTVLQLISAGANVTIIDNLSNSSLACKDRMESLCGKSLQLYTSSLNDIHSLQSIFLRQQQTRQRTFDAVVHFAGLKAVGESAQKPLEYFDNNVGGTIQLLKVMKEYQCGAIVFSSSATVYGIPSKCPIDESFPLQTTNPYGSTKLFIEEILRDVAKSDPTFTAVILRYFNPIGAHPSGNIGESPNGIPNNLLPYVMQVAVGRLPHVNVFGNDWPTVDGTGVRDYIHVDDLARGHVQALIEGVFHRLTNKNPLSNSSLSNCESYNLGTGKGVSVLELIAAVQKAVGKEIKYVFAKRRDGDVAISFADPSKAEKVLKWKAETSLADSVASSWKWQSSNPSGYPDVKAKEPSSPKPPALAPPSSSSPRSRPSANPNQGGFLSLPGSNETSTNGSISMSLSPPQSSAPRSSSSAGRSPPAGMLPPSPAAAASALAKARGSTAPPPAIKPDQAFHAAIDSVSMKRGTKLE